MNKPVLEGEALLAKAAELGVATGTGESHNNSDGGPSEFQAAEHEIQQRVLEAERHVRESRLWLVAFASAVASVVSAIAAAVSAYFAWAAVAKLVPL